MMMITFIYQYEPSSPKVVFEMSADSTLSEVVEQFDLFLKASGYSFEGTLDIVDEGGEDEANS